MNSQVKITALVENQTAQQNLIAEHGLSLWIQIGSKHLLFDTGASDAVCHNAKTLGVPLQQAKALILSHGHYDHTGGLASLETRLVDTPIFAHPDCQLSRFSRRPSGEIRDIGMPVPSKTILKHSQGRVHWVRRPQIILPGVGLTGEIKRKVPYENTGGHFFLDRACRQPDLLRDDLTLWIKTPRGLVFVFGCAHSGVINTIDQVCRQLRTHRIHALVGGFHLLNASPDCLLKTGRALVRRGVKVLAPCHCTGETAIQFFHQNFSFEIFSLSTGEKWKLSKK